MIQEKRSENSFFLFFVTFRLRERYIFMQESLPHHIALIPDGNRRWAREHGLQPWKGHKKGAERFFEIAESAFASDIAYITFWGASYDNLVKRSALEIKVLCSIICRQLTDKKIIARFMDNQIRVRFIGEWKKLINESKLNEVIAKREEETKKFTGRNLTILFGYDGTREMADVIKKMRRTEDPVNYETVKKNLWTGDLPPVDLVIRTGGEPHWSAGFMMWHAANAQFYFTQKFWPDFDQKELQKALNDYARRGRRFGK